MYWLFCFVRCVSPMTKSCVLNPQQAGVWHLINMSFNSLHLHTSFALACTLHLSGLWWKYIGRLTCSETLKLWWCLPSMLPKPIARFFWDAYWTVQVPIHPSSSTENTQSVVPIPVSQIPILWPSMILAQMRNSGFSQRNEILQFNRESCETMFSQKGLRVLLPVERFWGASVRFYHLQHHLWLTMQ